MIKSMKKAPEDITEKIGVIKVDDSPSCLLDLIGNLGLDERTDYFHNFELPELVEFKTIKARFLMGTKFYCADADDGVIRLSRGFFGYKNGSIIFLTRLEDKKYNDDIVLWDRTINPEHHDSLDGDNTYIDRFEKKAVESMKPISSDDTLGTWLIDMIKTNKIYQGIDSGGICETMVVYKYLDGYLFIHPR